MSAFVKAVTRCMTARFGITEIKSILSLTNGYAVVNIVSFHHRPCGHGARFYTGIEQVPGAALRRFKETLKPEDVKHEDVQKRIKEVELMTKDECDHLEADIDRAFKDGAVFSFLSLSRLVAAFPAQARSMLDEILGKEEAPSGPFRVALVQTSILPDGKTFLWQRNAHHYSAFILIVSDKERYNVQRFDIQRILGRKCELLAK